MTALLPFAKPVALKATAQRPTVAHIVRERRSAWWIGRSPALMAPALLLMSAVAGCAAETGHGEDDVQARVELGSSPTIFGGAKDDDPDSIPGVLALKIDNGDGTFELCSGALVSPNVVLTARHCVTKSITSSVACDENGRSTNGAHVSGEHDPSDITIYVGASPRFAGKSDATAAAIVAPKSEYLCDNDIALVVLDQKLTNIEPIAVRLGAGVAPGESVRSVGYGQNDKKLPIGTRLRKPNVPILAMGKGVSDSKTALGAHEFEVGKSICQGDSGGPAISEDTGAVVGVVSRGGECDEDFGHIYTTTAGWSSLFTDAFKIAGGAPIVESGEPVGTETGPRANPTVRSPLTAEKPASNESCAVGVVGSSRGTTGGVFLGLMLAAAVVTRKRPKR